MRTVSLVLCAALLTTTAAQAVPGGLPSVPEGARPAAAEALQTFSRLVTEDNAQELGFVSAEDADTASLGVPAMEFVVRLDALKRYNRDVQKDPRSLLTGGFKVVYPVLVRGEPRSLIELVKGRKGWRAASFGAPNLGRQLSLVRSATAASLKIDTPEFSIIRVPALSLYFLGHEIVNATGVYQLTLTPIANDARFEFTAGVSLPAEVVFARLKEIAQDTPDLPG